MFASSSNDFISLAILSSLSLFGCRSFRNLTISLYSIETFFEKFLNVRSGERKHSFEVLYVDSKIFTVIGTIFCFDLVIYIVQISVYQYLESCIDRIVSVIIII